MSEPILVDPVEGLAITFDFTPELVGTVTLIDVAFSGEGLTLGSQANDYGNGKATIPVSGVSYGMRYRLEATGTLSTGSIVNRAASILGWQK